jgi:hypothetical protein
MPITLAQAQNLSQDKLTQFVINEFRKSPLLDLLPFDNCILPQGGNTLAYTYNRVTTLGSAAFRAINSEYTPHEAATTPYTVHLKPFGGSYQMDRVIANYQKQAVDHVQFQNQQKSEATVALFHDAFLNGDAGVGDGTQFDGLDKALTGSSTELTPDSAIDLSSSANIDSNWKVFLDDLGLVRARMDKAPTLYLMNSIMFAKFQSVMKRAGINLASKENYGDEVAVYGSSMVMSLGDKPGTSNPIIETTEGVTSIYAVRLALDGVHGLSPMGDKLVDYHLPDFSTAGAVKTGDVEMVAAMAIKATRSAAVLRNVKIA